MKMIAYLLAIICAIAAVMYYTMPAGSLPTFMPGYAEGSTHIHHLHAYAAAGRRHRAVRDRLVLRPALPPPALAFAAHLALHAFVEARHADNDALMGAAADRLEFVAGFDAERHGAAFEPHHFGGRGDPHADRGRRGMADVEMDAEALMAGGRGARSPPARPPRSR